MPRGPNRQPGRFEVAVSNGTPTTARSTPSRSRAYRRRQKLSAPENISSSWVQARSPSARKA